MNDTVGILDFLRKRCLYLHNDKKSDRVGMCEAFFDGLLCWPFTKAGELSVQPCSSDFLESTFKGYASRQCTENGTWLMPQNFNNTWTNYSQCGNYSVTLNVSQDALAFYSKWLPIVKIISYIGYALSITSLVISICIVVNIKRLHCPRNKLHVNLFVSFVMRLFMSILKDSMFVGGTTLAFETIYDEFGEPVFRDDQHYSWICKAVISIRRYFILSNFTMMLMEGVYLHKLMFFNLLSDNTSVGTYCILGWGLPMLFVIMWVVTKAMFEDHFCWTQSANAYIALLIEVPIGITVVINFILFIVIVRVLITKLNSVCIQQRRIKYRKFLRATLILIPLFGIPYAFSLVMSFHVKESPVLELAWLFFDQSFTAFQGLFAALVYCLLNSEVQIEVKRRYLFIKDRRDKEFRRSRTISNTQQFSLNTNDDDWGQDKVNVETQSYM